MPEISQTGSTEISDTQYPTFWPNHQLNNPSSLHKNNTSVNVPPAFGRVHFHHQRITAPLPEPPGSTGRGATVEVEEITD